MNEDDEPDRFQQNEWTDDRMRADERERMTEPQSSKSKFEFLANKNILAKETRRGKSTLGSQTQDGLGQRSAEVSKDWKKVVFYYER